MPERYGVGRLYQTLNLCERFPQLKISDVLPGFDPANEAHVAHLLAYTHLRRTEEARGRAAWG